MLYTRQYRFSPLRAIHYIELDSLMNPEKPSDKLVCAEPTSSGDVVVLCGVAIILADSLVHSTLIHRSCYCPYIPTKSLN